jgi:hypothetical protein
VKAPSFKKGDMIVVVDGRTNIGCCITGLHGYVTDVFKETPDDPKSRYLFHVKVFQNPGNPGSKPVFGSDWVTTAVLREYQIVLMSQSNTAGYAWKKKRIQGLIDQDNTPDPEFDKVFKSIIEKTDAAMNVEMKRAAAVKAMSKKLGNVFPASGFVKRGDKSHYQSFHDPETQAARKEIGKYAARSGSKFTTKERARWAQAAELVARSSLFSNRQECRDVVREFDLDPFIDDHNDTLRHKGSYLVVPAGKLRVAVMMALNRGFEITHICDKKGDSCAGPENNPDGFVVWYAKRRQIEVEHLITDKWEDFLPHE